jgi:tRNA-2-methylthio-N6-dimethylallyladenosine synthase
VIENKDNKKFYIKTFGCQMNVYDSILIGEQLESLDYSETDDIKRADLILFNTCAIRALAEHKALSELGATKKLKSKNPNIKVGIMGCVAQNLGKKILSSYPFVDFVLGTKEMYKLPEYLEKKESYKNDKSILKLSLDEKIVGYESKKVNSVSAFITVVRGCTNFCSYCIVPFVRGKEESRNIDEIVSEVQKMADNGVKEIVLLGQNVNIFGKDINTNLQTLIKKINDIEGILRIRYFTSHPKDVNEDFVKAIKDIPKVCEHIHIPFQSGSNKILKSMNRKYTREEYIEKVKMIKKYISGVAVTSDIIVGYPTETEEDFQDTLDILKICQLDNIYSFKYSPRKGTISHKNLPDDVSKETKEKRLEILNNLENEISLSINEKMIDTEQEVLWESYKEINMDLDKESTCCATEIKSESKQALLEGRTRNYKKVFANVDFDEANKYIGKLDIVKIKKATVFSLYGEIL